MDLLLGSKWDDVGVPWDKEWEEAYARDDDDFIRMVEKGMKGQNIGYGNGLVGMNRHIYGTHEGRYYLIGADSGVGKTTLADFCYMIELWLDCRKKGVILDMHYFCFEISRIAKITNWVSYFVYRLFNIEMPADYIAGRIEGKPLGNTDLGYIRKAYKVVKEMLKSITIIDVPMHPTGILYHMTDHFEKVGTLTREKSDEKDKPGRITGYRKKDNRITVMMIDHLALAHEEKNANTLKLIMDKISMYTVFMRNMFGLTAVILQQFSTELTGAYRLKDAKASIAPQRIDFGDSKYTYRDADVVFGMIKPAMFDKKTYGGFDVDKLHTYLVMLHLMKNRYGRDQRIIPMIMNPYGGRFADLPLYPAKQATEMKAFYDMARHYDMVAEKFTPKAA